MAKLSAKGRTEIHRFEVTRQIPAGGNVTAVFAIMSDRKILIKSKFDTFVTGWTVYGSFKETCTDLLAAAKKFEAKRVALAVA